MKKDENGFALPVKTEVSEAERASLLAKSSEKGADSGNEREKSGKPIGENEIAAAKTLMMQYFGAKKAYDERIKLNYDIYNLLYTEQTNKEYYTDSDGNPKEKLIRHHVGAQTLNVILNKHADAMDNYPEPIFLPREASDEETAKMLTSIVPCILERNKYQAVYSNGWTDKLVGGAACYAVIWDPDAEYGMGDIRIARVNLLSMAWEPFIENIQDSGNVFCVDYVDIEQVKEAYPELKEVSTEDLGLTEFKTYDSRSKTENKAAVVDWYYKREGLLHLCKFVGNHVIFSSENEQERYPKGFYEDGKYPFVIDPLFPLRDTPVGFSFIDICRAPQRELDDLRRDILKNIKVNSQTRSLVDGQAIVNMDDLSDLNKDFIEAQNLNGGSRIVVPLETKDIAGGSLAMYTALSDEIKQTTGTNDASNGASAAGVTSGNAIAALQEAGGKISRDINKGGFRGFTEICELILERIRQFYVPERWFRIVGDDKKTEYVQFGNENLLPQDISVEGDDTVYKRVPVFDIDVKAQRSNPFTTAANNQMMVDMFRMGAFAPENTDAALAMLECMSFEGKDKLADIIKQNGGMAQALQQLSGQLQMANAMMAQQTADSMAAPAPAMTTQI